MSLQTIQEAINVKLGSSQGGRKVDSRRAKMKDIAAALKRIPKLPRLCSRNAWFSTTQSDVIKADGEIMVQLFGIKIAEIVLDTTEPHPYYTFSPDELVCKNIEWKDRGPWEWSHNKKHAEKINRFIEVCEKYPRAKSDNEREIQWQLAQELKSDTKGPFKNLQPVTWNGRFTEIGVSITMHGNLGTGNIDLVVRRKRGFLVFELKKPGDSEIEDALTQASRYAIALNIEANEGGKENLKNYRAVFGARGDSELNIGAVAVLEDNEAVRKKAHEILPLFRGNTNNTRVDRIGVLLYKFDKNEGKVTSWEWLPKWDAREPNLI